MKTEIKHPVITVIVVTLGILWVMAAIANNLPTPDYFTSNKSSLLVELDGLIADEDKVIEAVNLFNTYQDRKDPDWESRRVKVETIVVEFRNYYYENKADLIKTLEFDLSCGYQAGKISKPLYDKYAPLMDADWLAYESKVDDAIAYDQKIDAEKAAEKLRKKNFKDQFSPWDGSHYMFVEELKSMLNDPSSFEHVRTIRSDKSTLVMTYRAKNSFGVTVLERVACELYSNDDGTFKNIKNIRVIE